MKMGPRVSIAVFAVLFIAACKNHDSGSQMPAPTPQRGALLQSPVQQTASYSPIELLASLSGSRFNQALLQLAYTPICTINVYHLDSAVASNDPMKR
jgi:hypothetical protein